MGYFMVHALGQYSLYVFKYCTIKIKHVFESLTFSVFIWQGLVGVKSALSIYQRLNVSHSRKVFSFFFFCSHDGLPEQLWIGIAYLFII